MFTKRTPRTIMNWDLFASFVGFWEDTVTDNIGDEYERLVEHLNDCTRKRRRGAARAAGNHEFTSKLARRCREAIKEDFKERRAD
ncbi:hypothetical protein RB195_023664 [Necator americanus]|uniref:Uncharacterized protein n=1 Tax=Necator americanus TaxID=51031 RepID=A0ABR1EK52_NECAM